MNSAALIAKLESELLNEDQRDPRYCVGWNDRARSLIAELRIEQGLAELRSSEIDLRLKHELTGFDFGGES